MSIEGLYDPYKDNEEYTIYRALFDDFLNGYDPYRTRGDSRYGFDEWVKYKDGKGPPNIIFGPPPTD